MTGFGPGALGDLHGGQWAIGGDDRLRLGLHRVEQRLGRSTTVTSAPGTARSTSADLVPMFCARR